MNISSDDKRKALISWQEDIQSIADKSKWNAKIPSISFLDNFLMWYTSSHEIFVVL